jgi:hypothetical protein
VRINYIGQQGQLGGCINDAKNQQRALTSHFGFRDPDILLLTDDQYDRQKKPTAANIRNGFRWLLQGAQPGDMLVFHYSGHGSQVPDRTGQEADGKNEVLVPLDMDWKNNMITDDELFRTFDSVPSGVHLLCIYDCCHSGTVSDLPQVRGLPGADAPAMRYLEPPYQIQSALSQIDANMQQRFVPQRPQTTVPASKTIVTISGCQDNQTSADATIQGQRQGAMTWSMLSCLTDSSYRISYEGLLSAMRRKLRGRYEQVPGMATTSAKNWSLQYLLGGH